MFLVISFFDDDLHVGILIGYACRNHAFVYNIKKYMQPVYNYTSRLSIESFEIINQMISKCL